jgi:hypothetical protein
MPRALFLSHLPSWPRAAALVLLSLLMLAPALHAAPYTPSQDGQVLERLPQRATDPAARELQALRQAWRAQPQDPQAAAALARRYVQEMATSGDPRYIGYAQAALQPWWAQAAPPAPVRVLRAVLRQLDHQFDAALQDLKAVLVQEPPNAEAWSWRVAIEMVQADYAAAGSSCEGLAQALGAAAPAATPAASLQATACRTQVAAATGQAGAGAAALRTALAAAAGAAPPASPALRLWALTRLAETEERLGQTAAAEASYRQALALCPTPDACDVYLQAAFADFLLAQGRAPEVLLLLKDRSRADVLLLRLALAAKATGEPQAPAYARSLAARFAAAQQRGDVTHRKEHARFLLQVQGDAAAALPLAQANWAEQREPADALLLLQAALATRQPQAAQPVLQWLAQSRLESAALQPLAAQLKAVQ